MALTLTSEAFGAGQPIPKKYTGEGANVSPALHWTGAPVETQEFVLICDDPDAPRPQPWVHWVLYKIHSGTDNLPEGIELSPQPAIPTGARQGMNDFGQSGYGGPMPPKGHGVHHYHFTLYALDRELDLRSGLKKQDVLEAIEGHILAEGKLIGTYERK